jgi:hypothetical protein
MAKGRLRKKAKNLTMMQRFLIMVRESKESKNLAVTGKAFSKAKRKR